MWYTIQVAMDGLPYISHLLWMHGKDITSMRCNTYRWMPSIQTTDRQSYGARFCRICKPPSHSQAGMDNVSVVMYGLPPFSHVLWMHGKGMICQESNPYTGMPSIQAVALPRRGPRSGMICKPASHPQGGVGCDMSYKWPWMGYYPFHMSCRCTEKV